jgi:hypothetical protein
MTKILGYLMYCCVITILLDCYMSLLYNLRIIKVLDNA